MKSAPQRSGSTVSSARAGSTKRPPTGLLSPEQEAFSPRGTGKDLHHDLGVGKTNLDRGSPSVVAAVKHLMKLQQRRSDTIIRQITDPIFDIRRQSPVAREVQVETPLEAVYLARLHGWLARQAQTSAEV